MLPAAAPSMRLGAGALVAVLIAGLTTAPAGAQTAPAIPLPTGRALTPAGTLVSVGDFPASAVLAGGGLYVADNGQSVGDLVAVNPMGLAGTREALLVPNPPPTNAKPTANSGMLASSTDGTRLYLPGAATGTLHTFTVGAPGAAPPETSTVEVTGGPEIWGAAPTSDGHVLLTVTFAHNGLGPSSDEGDTVLNVDPATGAVVGQAVVGREPMAIASAVIPGQGERAVVADRESGELSILDPSTMKVVRTVHVGLQPAGFAFTPDRRDLLVTLAVEDRVIDLDTATWHVQATVDLAPGGGLGAAPTSIALDPSGTTAYVALSADDAIAVLARQAGGGWAGAGLIPTAAYLTAVAVDPGGGAHPAQLLVTAGKGTGLPVGTPVGLPVAAANVANSTQTGTGLSGVVEAIRIPDEATLAADTNMVAANNTVAPARPDCPAAPALAGINHVVYVIRENKTFDEEFGDEAPYGDPAYLMYGRQITPNTHAIAERSALLANFYSDEEVSDTGHAAVMGGVANDFLQRTTQQSYGLGGTPRQGPELGQDDDTVWSPTNFLLDNALAHGVGFRDYGEFYRHDQADDAMAVSSSLDAHIEHGFPGFGFDPNTPDTKRINYWEGQFNSDVANNTFPALEVIYLPEDHTTNDLPSASQPVPPTPQQQVADSDLATGRLIADLSRSPYWSSTALFLTEDDPQSGMDHVDDHRTIGLVTGGRVKQVATTDHYDSGSMLRTMEEILGLPALTERDATALAMDALFSTDAVNAHPYAAITPTPPPAPISAAALAAHAASVAGPNADPANLPSASQLQLQWYALRGAPFTPPAAKAAPAWGSSPPRHAVAVSPRSCASPQLPEAPVSSAIPVVIAAGLMAAFAVRRQRRSPAAQGPRLG